VVHPGWSFTTGYNDVSLCFLAASATQSPVMLARGGRMATVTLPAFMRALLVASALAEDYM
jgi:hypothetical protein